MRRTWRTANVRTHGQNCVRATPNRPGHSGGTAYATVRVTAHDAVGNSIQESAHVLQALVRHGLTTHTDATPRTFQVVSPDVALLPRIELTADALDTARAEAGRLLETYRETARRQDADQLLEVVTGAEALRQRLKQIQVNAREEMLCVLYEKAFFDDEGAIDNAVAGVRAGEVARSVPWLPLRHAIADRSVGIFPLAPGGPRYGENAVPLHLSARGDELTTDDTRSHPSLSPAEGQLLSLLVAGVADKAIASQLGLSRRQHRKPELLRRGHHSREHSVEVVGLMLHDPCPKPFVRSLPADHTQTSLEARFTGIVE